jgi:hypothetical protein
VKLERGQGQYVTIFRCSHSYHLTSRSLGEARSSPRSSDRAFSSTVTLNSYEDLEREATSGQTLSPSRCLHPMVNQICSRRSCSHRMPTRSSCRKGFRASTTKPTANRTLLFVTFEVGYSCPTKRYSLYGSAHSSNLQFFILTHLCLLHGCRHSQSCTYSCAAVDGCNRGIMLQAIRGKR